MADQTAELDLAGVSETAESLISSVWLALAELAAVGAAAGSQSVRVDVSAGSMSAIFDASFPRLTGTVMVNSGGSAVPAPAWVAALDVACAGNAEMRGVFLVSGLVAARAAMDAIPYRIGSVTVDAGASGSVTLAQSLVALVAAGSAGAVEVVSGLMRFYVYTYAAAVAQLGADGVVKMIAELNNIASVSGIVHELQVTLRAMAEVASSGGVQLELGGEVWQCWALTGRRFDASVYSGFAFNSFCRFNGQVFAAKEDGVYLIDGDTDAGGAITAGVAWGATHLGTLCRKRLRSASFGLVGVAPALRVITDNGERIYAIDPADHGDSDITRMLIGREWSIEVQGFDKLEFVDLVPVILAS